MPNGMNMLTQTPPAWAEAVYGLAGVVSRARYPKAGLIANPGLLHVGEHLGSGAFDRA